VQAAHYMRDICVIDICVIDATPQGEHPRAMSLSTMLHLSIVNHNICNNRMASVIVYMQLIVVMPNAS
jgi:hypothetical protein